MRFQLFLQPRGHSLGTVSFPVHFPGSRPEAFHHALGLCSDTPFHCRSTHLQDKEVTLCVQGSPVSLQATI